MSEILTLLMSPAGIVLYAGFWAIKLLFGAAAVRWVILRLPERAQTRVSQQLARMKFWGRKTTPLA